jgi:hypothetical protein
MSAFPDDETIDSLRELPGVSNLKLQQALESNWPKIRITSHRPGTLHRRRCGRGSTVLVTRVSHSMDSRISERE